jgi:hypothetical protein
LDAYLRQHPEVGMARQKEVHFFDNEKVFSQKEVEYGLLESQFNWDAKAKCYGESSPIYLYWEPAMKRIWNYNPSMKLIAILRNPAERAFSHWNMETGRGKETTDFFSCIKNEKERSKEALPYQHRIYSYVDRGMYAQQVRRVFRYFPKQQVLFIKYEDYLQNQVTWIEKVFEFLGVGTNHPIVEQKTFSSTYIRKISLQEREYLNMLFKNDINEVEQLLGWDCADWKN